MQSVERLVAEHNLIERGLALVEKAIARSDAGQPVPDGFLTWAATFLQQFADGCHHAKEEDVLFPLLKQRGIPEQGGPIGCMLHEHGMGRDCVGRMAAAAQAQPVDVRSFVEAARQYVPLLRQHIFKENNVLFRMAEHVMNAADDADAVRRYAEIEQSRGLTDMLGRYADETAGWERTLT